MVHQELLRRVVKGRSPALVDFVEIVVPRLLERFATIPALGGSGRLRPLTDPCLPKDMGRFSEKELSLFSEKNPDQSLLTHTLNGIFAGQTLAERLPPEKALSDVEQRLLIMAHPTHDYTKVYGIKVPAGELDTIRQVVRCLGKDLNFDAYLPNWLDYLDDIVFLVQNTQKFEGANLNLRDYRLRIHPRRLDVLRLLSSYADVLTHIKSPSEVLLRAADGRDRAGNLRNTLADLFGAGRAPRLAYHKLTDVRGLLSNLVNNAVMTKLEKQGYEPYLFFPNGVVYLANPEAKADIDPKELAREVWKRVIDLLAGDERLGIKRANKGIKIAPPLYEFVDTRRILELGLGEAMRITKSYAAERLYGFATGKSKTKLQTEFSDYLSVCEDFVRRQGWPADVRVDILAEFLIFVKRCLFGSLFGRGKQADSWLLEKLKLGDAVSLEEATRSIRGGISTGWFYAASQFIKIQQIGEPEELRPFLQQIADDFLALVLDEGFSPRIVPRIKQDFLDYLSSIIEVDGKLISKDARELFETEYANYTTRKNKKEPICSICSSPYSSREQMDTVVLWLAQQYSNRNPLGGDMVKRGICSICTIEMMLRQIWQREKSKRSKPIYFYLYPTYFFTLETERIAKSFLMKMADLSLFALRQHLEREGFSLEAFLRFDGFLEEDTRKRRSVRTPPYREDEPAGLVFGSLTPLGRKPTDTDSWVIPALLAVSIPLLLDVKVVVTPSPIPLFASGADFRETVLLDGPHAFTRHVWGRDRFRVDELEEALFRLLNLLDLHLDIFAEGYDPHWPRLNAVARNVAFDPYYVFSYYDHKKRRTRAGKRREEQTTKKDISRKDLERYFRIYYALGGKANMGIIGELVDAYASFYRASKLGSAYEVLRPMQTAIDIIVKSDPDTERDDLLLLVAGAVNDLINRVLEGQAKGWIPLKKQEQQWFPLLRRRIEEFSRLCVDDLFYGYCQGERALLQERFPCLRSAARFYYLQNYGMKRT